MRWYASLKNSSFQIWANRWRHHSNDAISLWSHKMAAKHRFGAQLVPAKDFILYLESSSVFINLYYLFIVFIDSIFFYVCYCGNNTNNLIWKKKKNPSFIAVMKFPLAKCVHTFLILYLKHSSLSKYTVFSTRGRIEYQKSELGLMLVFWSLFKKYSWSRCST